LVDEWNTKVKVLWHDADDNSKALEKSLSHCHFVHHRCHMNRSGINPRPPCWVADEVYEKSITSYQHSSEMMGNPMLKARTVVQGNFES